MEKYTPPQEQINNPESQFGEEFEKASTGQATALNLAVVANKAGLEGVKTVINSVRN